MNSWAQNTAPEIPRCGCRPSKWTVASVCSRWRSLSGSTQRLQARAFADIIACDIHPLNNLSPLAVLREKFGADEVAIGDWYRDWIVRGFTALEMLAVDLKRGTFLFGDVPSLAEIVLVPQVANAHRFRTDLSPFPRLVELDDRCRKLEAFRLAAPENQKQP